MEKIGIMRTYPDNRLNHERNMSVLIFDCDLYWTIDIADPSFNYPLKYVTELSKIEFSEQINDIQSQKSSKI